jgi:tyrosine-protein kinase Etk/Wzc
LIDIGTAAGMYTSETQKYNSAAMELETQIRLAKYIRNYLVDPAREVDLIPSNTGLSDMNIEGQINQYNLMKLRRDKLLDDSSDRNPIVQELNNSLRAMRQTIIRAVDNMIVSLDVRLNDAWNLEKRAQTRIASVPSKQRQMLSIERQQKIKESLYIFLLNKREENALTQAMADNNARVMDEADGSLAPIYPQRNKMLLLGILIGIALPALFFIVSMFVDTRVRSRKDIEDAVSVPFIGEIPYLKQKKESSVQVRNDGNDMLSEAFRIIRTNIGYMGINGKQPQVITFTSFNIGAGKTFVGINLSACFTYTGKRVVVLDLDIRKRSLTAQLHPVHQQKGVTNFLSNNTLEVDDILVKDIIPGLDMIPAGPVAPNPVELLMNVRLEKLIAELRSRYDYIIIDNVPFGIVADASIINRITDLTVFVVRAGRLDRRMLPEIEKMYEEKKLNNLALLLNGSDLKRGGYGYHYGYHYGYGYGYEAQAKKKQFWKK